MINNGETEAFLKTPDRRVLPFSFGAFAAARHDLEEDLKLHSDAVDHRIDEIIRTDYQLAFAIINAARSTLVDKLSSDLAAKKMTVLLIDAISKMNTNELTLLTTPQAGDLQPDSLTVD